MDEIGWHGWLVICVVGGTFFTLALSRLPSDFVFLGGLGILLLSGVLTPAEAFSGFASEGLITVGLLYIVVSGVKETGGLSWISNNVLGQPRSYVSAKLRLMLPVSTLSAFLNNTPIVALFIPIVMEWSRRIRIEPSRLLIPLSYASIFGGICTLIGTSTNLVINGLVQSRYQTSLSMFEIAKIGLPCAVAGIIFVVVFPRLLPNRKAFTQVIQNPKEYTLEMLVFEESRLVGKTIESGGLRHLPGVFVAELIRGNQIFGAVQPDQVLQSGDRLIFVGNVESMQMLHQLQDLRPAPDQIFKIDAPRHTRKLVEAVVSNTCPLIGMSIKEGRFRDRYNAVVIAVARNGERIIGRIGDIVLRPGDILLIEAHAGFVPRQRDSRDFYIVSEVENSIPKRYERAQVAFAILIGMVVVATVGWLSMLEAALFAAGLMLITGCCTSSSARKSVEWEVLLTIAAALGLGIALDKTGVAGTIASTFMGVSNSNPWVILAIVYIVTSIFTEIITNNAAAALIFPIAMTSAEQLGVSPTPFIFALMIAASASFATPIGYQTNLMIYGPGGYRFSDYLKIGIPLNILIAVITIALAPLIWPF